MLGDEHIACGEATYALALLHWAAGDARAAASEADAARAIYEAALGDDNVAVAELQATLDRMRADAVRQE